MNQDKKEQEELFSRVELQMELYDIRKNKKKQISEDTEEIDITGLNKLELLRLLWQNTKPASFFTIRCIPPPPFDETKAKTAITGEIDYFEGRGIKCDLSKDLVWPNWYDRVAGIGAFATIVKYLRNKTTQEQTDSTN